MRIFRKKVAVKHSVDLIEEIKSCLPPGSVEQAVRLLNDTPCYFNFAPLRKSKLGDFRVKPGEGLPRVSVNKDLHPLIFLTTLVHELAHVRVHHNASSRRNAPHGKEWKKAYRDMLGPFVNETVFKEHLSLAQEHLKKAPASLGVNDPLHVLLPKSTPEEYAVSVQQLKEGSKFETPTGRSFLLGEKRRVRYLCKDLVNGKSYLVHGKALVKPLP